MPRSETLDLAVRQDAAVAGPQPDGNIMAIIGRMSCDPNADVDKFERLLAAAERIRALDAEKAFNQAMRDAQDEMKPVVRDTENKHTGSRYAKLEAIDAAIRPIYTGHGFSLSFNSAEPRKAGAVRILCDVRHVEGHTKSYELEGDLDMAGAQGKSNKTSIQGLGSTVSYLRRYLTCMIFNVTLTNEDNDGGRVRGVEFITRDQADNVISMLREIGLNATDPNFLAWCGVDKVEHIMPQGLPRVIDKLGKMRAAR